MCTYTGVFHTHARTCWWSSVCMYTRMYVCMWEFYTHPHEPPDYLQCVCLYARKYVRMCDFTRARKNLLVMDDQYVSIQGRMYVCRNLRTTTRTLWWWSVCMYASKYVCTCAHSTCPTSRPTQHTLQHTQQHTLLHTHTQTFWWSSASMYARMCVCMCNFNTLPWGSQ